MARPVVALQPAHTADPLNPVVIAGAGLSGLAAGAGLAARGIPVTVLEQRPVPGGRATSFIDQNSGEEVDNGQHVLIAGYAHTLRFLDTIGTREFLNIQKTPELPFHHPVRGFQTVRFPALPSPLHLAAGIAGTRLFTGTDKLRLLRAGGALRRMDEKARADIAGLTVEQWLDAVGQSEETKRSFWEPLAIAVMNEHIGAASAAVFVRSMREAFLSDPRGASLALPSVGLSRLYAEPAAESIRRRGGAVRCGADVVESIAEGDKIQEVRLRSGESIACSALILAVPSYRAASLLPAELRSSGFLDAIGTAPLSPIVSIHLWFDADFMPQSVLGVIGRHVQWLFNRRKIARAGGRGGYVTAVISAAHETVDKPNDEIIRIACDDLAGIYGTSAREPRRALVIREKRATFSCTPAMEILRPAPITPIGNLFLAGDWTATGYPATIEGAVLSGERCVNLAEGWLRRLT
ncbi:MAG: hydroxysqualene dehydroxylase HpnE [Bacteroidota bacterium]